MTTEYHDDVEDDSSSFWNKEPSPVSLSGVSRFRRWLFPVVMVTIILVLIIAVGATNTKTISRLWSTEKKVSNLTEGLTNAHQLTKGKAKDVQRLKFAVEYNKDQLSSVSDALKQLSVLDSISRTVASLKCSLERLIHNTSAVDGCCPLDWDQSGSSCYFFSKTALAWHDARDWCNGHESHLVILMTDDDWDFVIRHATGTFYWVGLTDERTGKWEWVNQTPYIMNRRWVRGGKPGQPDAWTEHGLGPGDEDCAHLHSDGRLNDLHCSTRMRFICQSHHRGIHGSG
uniref:C-type lectin domain-containing protein n=1 Tax=Sphaeramia orbicularis TaxID=375764 RepID=A0A672YFW3_9TELE